MQRTKCEPLRLSDGWALCHDQNQWIVHRHVGTLKSGPSTGREEWRPVAFVASTKMVLLRVLSEMGVVLEPSAATAVAAMPVRFLDWIGAEHSPSVA